MMFSSRSSSSSSDDIELCDGRIDAPDKLPGSVKDAPDKLPGGVKDAPDKLPASVKDAPDKCCCSNGVSSDTQSKESDKD